MKHHWQTWVLGIVSVLLAAWVRDLSSEVKLIVRLEERIVAIQADIKDIKEAIKVHGK